MKRTALLLLVRPNRYQFLTKNSTNFISCVILQSHWFFNTGNKPQKFARNSSGTVASRSQPLARKSIDPGPVRIRTLVVAQDCKCVEACERLAIRDMQTRIEYPLAS